MRERGSDSGSETARVGERERTTKNSERGQEKGRTESTSENVKRGKTKKITQKKDYRCSGAYQGWLDICKLYGNSGMDGSTAGCFFVQHLQLRLTDSNVHPPESLCT